MSQLPDITKAMFNVLIKLHAYWSLEHEVKKSRGFRLIHPDNPNRRVLVNHNVMNNLHTQSLVKRIVLTNLIDSYEITSKGKQATCEHLKLYQYPEETGIMDSSELIKRINEGLKY